MNKFALCAGRHTMPNDCQGSIFPNEINPTDLLSIQAIANDFVRQHSTLGVYVTGLTVALVAVINACHQYGVELTLYHFDRNTSTYYPQKVV